MLAGVLVAGTIGFALIERDWTLWQCMYFTLVTVTTVGYGDYGLCPAGQVFAAFLLLCGIGVFTYSLSTLVQIASDREAAGKRAMKRKVAECTNHIIICGYGRMGRTICLEIEKDGVPCVVIENSEHNLQRAIDDGQLVVHGEASDDEVLIQAGLMRAKGIVCAVDTDAGNIYITITARDLNPGCNIISRAEDESAARKLERAGASLVVSPHHMAGRTVASAVLSPRLAKYTNGFDDDQAFKMGETFVAPGSALVGQTVAQFGVTVPGMVFIAIERQSGYLRLRPRGDDIFEDGDVVIYASGKDDLARIKEAASDRQACLV
jgi:voltage-gated potassium channel